MSAPDIASSISIASSSSSPLHEIDRKILEVEEEITKVCSEIDKVEKEIQSTNDKILGGDPTQDWKTEKHRLCKEKEQLRNKEEQLRKKEEQLREEKILLLQRAVPSSRIVRQFDLLRQIQQSKSDVDEEVLQVIKERYIDRLVLLESREEFLKLYGEAEERMGTSTKNAIIAVEPSISLTVNGQLNFGGSESFFFRGLFRGVPCVLKFPPTKEMAELEVSVLNQVPVADREHLVDVSLVSVTVLPPHKLSRTTAIKMPFFSSSLDSWPTQSSMVDLISRVATSIFAALDAFHRSQLVHCDCKPGNIFINTEGNAFLGDYNAVVALNEPVQRCTMKFLPRELVSLRQRGILKATAAVDFAMLACTLARMMNIPLPASSSFYTVEALLARAQSEMVPNIQELPHDVSSNDSRRNVFRTICDCLVKVQEDPQYVPGANLLMPTTKCTVAVDDSYELTGMSKLHPLGEQTG